MNMPYDHTHAVAGDLQNVQVEPEPELEPCTEEVDSLYGNVWGFRPCGETERRHDGLCVRHDAHRTTTAARIVRNTLPHVIRELEAAVKYAGDAEPDATGYYDRPAVLARILADLREVRR